MIEKAKDLYIGGLTASEMATALHKAARFCQPVPFSAHREDLARRCLISNAPERTLARRGQAQQWAEEKEAELAANIDVWSTWSNGDQVIQEAIDYIASLKKQAKTGIDPYVSRYGDRQRAARMMREVRRLKRDGDKLKAAAFALLDNAGIDRFAALAGIALTLDVDYSEWAQKTVASA